MGHHCWCGNVFGKTCIEKGHQIKCTGCGEWHDKRYSCPKCKAVQDRRARDERDQRRASREKMREQYLADQKAAKKQKAADAKVAEKARGEATKKKIDQNNKDLSTSKKKDDRGKGGNRRRRKVTRRRKVRR